MGRGASWAAAHGVAKSQTGLTEPTRMHACFLSQAAASHSPSFHVGHEVAILSWHSGFQIPGGGLAGWWAEVKAGLATK